MENKKEIKEEIAQGRMRGHSKYRVVYLFVTLLLAFSITSCSSDLDGDQGNQEDDRPTTTIELNVEPINKVYNSIVDIEYANDAYMAVDEDGCIYKSTDGISWHHIVCSADEVNNIEFGNGTFVVAGKDGTIQISSTGEEWSEVQSGTTNDIYALEFADGKFVAVGESGLILTSLDGQKWSPRASGVDSSLIAVAYGNGKWVAVGDDGVILVSTDDSASIWELFFIGQDDYLSDVIFDGTQFVVVDLSSTEILYSTDGSDWMTIELEGKLPYIAKIYYAADLNAYFVPSDEKLYRSDNLSDWTMVEEFPGDIRKLLHAGSYVYAIGSASDDYWSAREILLISEDLDSWFSTFMREDLLNAAFILNKFIVIGKRGLFLTSTDGVTWKVQTKTNFNYETLKDIIYCNGQYILITEEGNAWISTDLLAWEVYDITSESKPTALACSADTYVSVTADGSIYASNDGKSWNEVAAGLSYIYDVEYGNDTFVAVGDKGLVLVSDDGFTWQTVTLDDSYDEPIVSVLYEKDKFYALSLSCDVIYSPTGLDWGKVTLPSSDDNCADITVSMGYFFVTTSSLDIFASEDANEWQEIDEYESYYHYIKHIIGGDERIIATGTYGAAYLLKIIK